MSDVYASSDSSDANATRRRRRWTIVLVASAVAVVGAVFAKKAFDRWMQHYLVGSMVGPRAVTIPPTPFALTSLERWLGGFPAGTKVHCLYEYIDSAWILGIPTTQDVVDRLIQPAELSPMESAAVPPSFFDKPVSWWPARADSDSRFYCTASFDFEKRGAEVDQYVAMYSPATGVLYIWVKHNF